MRNAPGSPAVRPVDDLRMELPRSAHAPRIARALAQRWCESAGVEQRSEQLLLLLSEVVTNAFMHSDASPETRISVAAGLVGPTIHVAVSDSGSRFVTRPERRPDSSGGFGLLVLDAEARRWGVDRDGGTRVWFEL